MRVLLTGGTGLIGRNIGVLLAQKGHEIVVVSRQNASEVIREMPFPCEVITWNGSGPLPKAQLNGIKGLIHLAGEPIAVGRWTAAKKKRLWSSRVDYTESLLRELKAADVQLESMVSASAIGFYGDRKSELLTETASAGTGFLAELCQAWEKAAVHGLGVTPAIVRVGLVLSPEGGALTHILPPFRWGIGGVLGSGAQYMSWIHIEDLTALFVYLLEERRSGVFNGVAPGPVENREFTHILSEVLQVPAIMPVPELALKAIYGELSKVLLASQNVRPHNVLNMGFKFKYFDIATTLRQTCNAAAQGADEYVSRQWLPAPIDQVFAFFSNEKNLERLTPPFLNFVVENCSTPQMRAGTLIDYSLRLRGLPIRWQTRIETWEPVSRFVDTQLKGPYKVWHHTHEFTPMGKGTLMTDRVLYKLPLSFAGRAVAGVMVRKDVEQIFAYRRLAVNEIFPYKEPYQSGNTVLSQLSV